MKQSEAAEALGISQACVSEYESSKRSPEISRALEIAEKTGGAVPVESWAEPAAATG